MVWNHPKETSICISYGRMFQLHTSLVLAKRQGQSEYENLVKNSNQKKMADNRSLGSKQVLFASPWGFEFPPIQKLGNPGPLPGFFFGGGEIRMERGNTERDVNEYATVLPMCPFLDI